MIKAIDKTVRVLHALDANESWIGVRELARAAGLPAPTAHSILNSLVELSFAEFDPEHRRYRLGLAAIHLGGGTAPLNSMRTFVRPYIESLAKEFDETVGVLVWRNDQATAIDWIQAEHPLAVMHERGIIERPLLLAAGRVLLAYQTRATQLRYAARENFSTLGSNAPTNTEEMLQLLDDIVRDGFSIARNVGDSGVAAVGVPVFDANRRILLTIGCSQPLNRNSETHLEAVRVKLLETSKLMTQRMGGQAAKLREPAA